MKINKVLIMALMTAMFFNACFAFDLTTVNGLVYSNASLVRTEADGIVLSYKGGISKVFYSEMSASQKTNYGFSAERYTAFVWQQAQTRANNEKEAQNRAVKIAEYSAYTNKLAQDKKEFERQARVNYYRIRDAGGGQNGFIEQGQIIRRKVEP